VKHSLPLNKEWIDDQALTLVKKLQSHNHTTYLVGGCVRDLLVGLPPKDWDIATSALPREVNKIIRPSHVIGRRFQLVLVKRYGEQYEISTFRAQAQSTDEMDGPITDDNTFGTPEEDAKRRDFTINSFFYDPIACELLDYCNGLKDIEDRVIRMIGDPIVRIQEDPLRMLRAIRFAHKTNFTIEESLRVAITKLAEQINLSVLPRKREEFLKFLKLKTVSCLLWECQDLNLLKYLSPTLSHVLEHEDGDLFTTNLNHGLSCVSDFSNPNELYSILFFSLISARNEKFPETLSLNEKQLNSLSLTMKDEFGMFRIEQENFFNSLELIKQLQGLTNIKKIRERYKVHLLKGNSMNTALTLAYAYKLLPQSVLHYWMSEYWRIQEKV
jgi:poly(A) polymerase